MLVSISYRLVIFLDSRNKYGSVSDPFRMVDGHLLRLDELLRGSDSPSGFGDSHVDEDDGFRRSPRHQRLRQDAHSDVRHL